MNLFKICTNFLISLLVFTCVNCQAEFFRDIVVTAPDGIWTDSRAYNSLSDAITAIGTSEQQSLYIADSRSVTSDLTIPSNINLHVLPNGLLTISAGRTLTINGSFNAGLYQVFAGDGSVSFGSGATENVYPQWWKTYHDGIHCDGLATDKAITACLSFGGHIILTPGDWYWISTVPEIHEEIPDMLVISGYGATINLCNAAPTAFNLRSLSGDQSKHIQNILLEGYNVDAHDSGVWNDTGGSMVGCIVTTAYVAPDYFQPYNTSIRDITIRDIVAKNVVETKYDLSVCGICGISIGLRTTSQATEILNILVDNIVIDGGSCGVLISRQGGDPANTNTWLDNIVINNVRHTISQEKSGYYSASNIMIGGGGRCGTVKISNCYGSNSGDVGIQVDCTETLIVENTLMDNSRNVAFYFGNAAEPKNWEEQTILLKGCTARYIDQTWDNGPGYAFISCDGVSDTRQATLRDCKYIHNGRNNIVSYGQYIQGRVDELITIDGFTIEDVCNFDDDLSTQTRLVGFNIRSDVFYASNIRANIEFNNNSALNNVGFRMFELHDVDHFMINGVDLDLDVAENPGLLTEAYFLRFGIEGTPDDASGGGSLKNADVNVEAGIDFYPVCCMGQDQEMSAKLVVENCDFDEVADFADLVYTIGAPTNRYDLYTNIRFRQNDYPASEAIYKTYALINGTKIIVNDTYRKCHWFPDTTKVTGIQESYDHGNTYITSDINKTTVSEGTWLKITANAAHDINLYFADD